MKIEIEPHELVALAALLRGATPPADGVVPTLTPAWPVPNRPSAGRAETEQERYLLAALRSKSAQLDEQHKRTLRLERDFAACAEEINAAGVPAELSLVAGLRHLRSELAVLKETHQRVLLQLHEQHELIVKFNETGHTG